MSLSLFCRAAEINNSMATEGTGQQLSPKQMVDLAAALSADKMAAIAEGYMGIDDVTIKNLQYDYKGEAQTFNREIIRCWAFKTPENQVQVII